MKILVPSEGKNGSIIEKEVRSIKEKMDILIIQLEGNLFFGSAEDLQAKLEDLADKSKVFILRMKYVANIDLTALGVLKVFIRTVKESGGTVIFSGVKSEFSTLLVNTHINADVGEDNVFMSENEIFASSTSALERAQNICGLPIGSDEADLAACKAQEAKPILNVSPDLESKNTASF